MAHTHAVVKRNKDQDKNEIGPVSLPNFGWGIMVPIPPAIPQAFALHGPIPALPPPHTQEDVTLEAGPPAGNQTWNDARPWEPDSAAASLQPSQALARLRSQRQQQQQGEDAGDAGKPAGVCEVWCVQGMQGRPAGACGVWCVQGMQGRPAGACGVWCV